MKKIILKILNNFIPKNKNQICFLGPWNETTGNNYLFIKFLKKYNPENIDFISINDKSIMRLNIKNIKNIFNIFRSKIIITTHGGLSIKGNSQILISFFHGPLSKQGGLYKVFLKNKEKGINFYNTIDYQFSTSKFISSMYSHNLCLHPSKFIYLGEPILNYYENINDINIKNKIKNLKKQYKKIILYAPTYRGTYQNYDINNVLKDFYKVIENNKNIYFIISLHPLDKNKITNNKNYSNIEFFNKNTDNILPYIDTLITDSSSIVYYGIYLKKEIIIFFPDYNKYIKGIDLFWNRLELFPKEIIFKKYEKNIENILNNYNIDLSFLRNLLYEKNKYTDNKKIYTFIKNKLNNGKNKKNSL